MLRRLCHAFALHDGEQNMEIAQPDAATNSFRPLHRADLASLAELISYGPEIRNCQLTKIGARFRRSGVVRVMATRLGGAP